MVCIQLGPNCDPVAMSECEGSCLWVWWSHVCDMDMAISLIIFSHSPCLVSSIGGVLCCRARSVPLSPWGAGGGGGGLRGCGIVWLCRGKVAWPNGPPHSPSRPAYKLGGCGAEGWRALSL